MLASMPGCHTSSGQKHSQQQCIFEIQFLQGLLEKLHHLKLGWGINQMYIFEHLVVQDMPMWQKMSGGNSTQKHRSVLGYGTETEGYRLMIQSKKEFSTAEMSCSMKESVVLKKNLISKRSDVLILILFVRMNQWLKMRQNC